MVIAGKQAVSLRLHCPVLCGGYIERDVLMYLLEDNSLYVYGACGECGQHGDITLSLVQLIEQCPLTTTAVM